ncbi:MAG TPA: phosphopantetheine-binding protein, partial [Ktedonobacterales bacterium]
PPALPFISNVTGTWITAADATDPRYWARHARQTVRFAAGARELLADPAAVLLEVGAGHTLATLARQSALSGATADRMVLTSLPPARDAQSSTAVLLTALGKLWLAGAPVDWRAFSQGQHRHRMPLPTYPFERQRYWVDGLSAAPSHLGAAADSAGTADIGSTRSAPPSMAPPTESAGASHPRPGLMTPYVAPATEIQRSIAAIWEEILGTAPIGIHDDFFELGGHSLIGTQLMARLHEAFPVDLPLRAIFEASTIEALAVVIEELLLKKIEVLSEEEARLLTE